MSKIKPEFIYASYFGTIYNLTPENQAKVSIPSVHFVLGDFLRMEDVFQKMPSTMSVKSFYGFANKRIYLSPVEARKKRVRGCEDLNSVDVECFGFKSVTNQKYLDIAKLIAPDILVSLTEEPRVESKGKKSIKRNVKKSLKFLEETISFAQKNQMASKIFAPLQGSVYKDVRLEHITEVAKMKDNISGVVLFGLYDLPYDPTEAQNGDKPKLKLSQTRSELILQAVENFPDKTIVLSSTGEPLKVLEAYRFGVDTFESSYPFDLARVGKASVIDVRAWTDFMTNLSDIDYLVDKAQVDQLFERQKMAAKTIDISSVVYLKDLTPLLANCKCYTCQKFTKSYVHHLLAHNEMTANVLLTIHNCFVYQQFFTTLESELFLQDPNRAILSFFGYYAEEQSAVN